MYNVYDKRTCPICGGQVLNNYFEVQIGNPHYLAEWFCTTCGAKFDAEFGKSNEGLTIRERKVSAECETPSIIPSGEIDCNVKKPPFHSSVYCVKKNFQK